MHACTMCSRSYKSLSYYERHIQRCHPNSNPLGDDVNITIPQLYEWCLELSKQNERLQQKVDELIQWKNERVMTQRPCHGVEALNQRNVACMDDYLRENVLTEDQFVCMRNYEVMNGLMYALTSRFPLKDVHTLPLVAFTHTVNEVFIRKETEWQSMTTHELKKILEYISKECMQWLMKWHDQNQAKWGQEQYMDEYTNTLRKFLIPYDDTLLLKIKKRLYVYLKRPNTLPF